MMTSELLRTVERALAGVAPAAPSSQEEAKDVREIEVSLTYQKDDEGWNEIIRFPRHSTGKTTKINVTFQGTLMHATLDKLKIFGQDVANRVYHGDLKRAETRKVFGRQRGEGGVTPAQIEAVKRGPWKLKEVNYDADWDRTFSTTMVTYRCKDLEIYLYYHSWFTEHIGF
jgi:hypothetical protein